MAYSSAKVLLGSIAVLSVVGANSARAEIAAEPRAGGSGLAAAGNAASVQGGDANGGRVTPTDTALGSHVGRDIPNANECADVDAEDVANQFRCDVVNVLNAPLKGVDWLNPFSGDGYGSTGSFVGRGLQDSMNQYALTRNLPATVLPAGSLDYVNPWSGGGMGSYGQVGRDLGVGLISPAIIGFDTLNPWSGDGVGTMSSVGRGLTAPSPRAPASATWAHASAGWGPAMQSGEVPQTTISISIPTFGAPAGMVPMMAPAPAYAQPQYQMQPTYAATPAPIPAQVAMAQPALTAFPVKCRFDNTRAFAQTVENCEEAGGLVEPLAAE